MFWFAILAVNLLLPFGQGQELRLDGYPAFPVHPFPLPQVIPLPPPQGVNLVEFNMRDTLFGRCSFVHEDQLVELLYEEQDGELSARAVTPTDLNAVFLTNRCREASAQTQQETTEGRENIYPVGQTESRDEIAFRLAGLQHNLFYNQQYIDSLTPRFRNMMKNLGLTVGGGSRFGMFPTLSVHKGDKSQHTSTTDEEKDNGFSFSFKPPFGK